MSKVALKLSAVMCEDGTTDYKVGANTNSNTNDKVQAFVDTFKVYAQTVYNNCYRLPIKFTLTLWGAESQWGVDSNCAYNQNWANMKYSSSTNPIGSIAQDSRGFAIFEGINHHSTAFAEFLKRNSRYSGLINYLKTCQNNGTTPSETKCFSYIANAGYCEGNPQDYINFLADCCNTLVNHSNIN